MSGLELLGRVRREQPGTDFVLLTAHASVESAVEALRHGREPTTCEKPIQPEELALVLERVLAAPPRCVEENARLRDALRTVESCRVLARASTPARSTRWRSTCCCARPGAARGLALFRRSAAPGSDGIAFRGFGDDEAQRPARSLVHEKPIDLRRASTRIEVLDAGPVVERSTSWASAPSALLAVPVHRRGARRACSWSPRARPPDRRSSSAPAPIAAHAELALANAERYHRAKERAFIDDVTEVYNARYLLQAIEREIHRAERYGSELSVLFLDLDRFKRVNDQYGHLVGSHVLRRLSRVLAECVRQVDTLARYGGDEFTILLRRHRARRARRRSPSASAARSPRRCSRPAAATPIRLTMQRRASRPIPHHGRDREDAARRRRQGDVPGQVAGPQLRLLGARDLEPESAGSLQPAAVALLTRDTSRISDRRDSVGIGSTRAPRASLDALGGLRRTARAAASVDADAVGREVVLGGWVQRPPRPRRRDLRRPARPRAGSCRSCSSPTPRPSATSARATLRSEYVILVRGPRAAPLARDGEPEAADAARSRCSRTSCGS